MSKKNSIPNDVSLTRREWLTLAWILFKTTDNLDWAFICPSCKKTWTTREFVADGGDADSSYQECIRRRAALARDVQELPKGMCDWCSYGLFRGPWAIKIEDGKDVYIFAFRGATAEAIALAKNETDKFYAEATAFQDKYDRPEPAAAEAPGPICETSAAGFQIGDKVGYKSVIEDNNFQHVGKVRSVHPNGIPSSNEPMLMIEGKGGVVLASHCTLLERP